MTQTDVAARAIIARAFDVLAGGLSQLDLSNAVFIEKAADLLSVIVLYLTEATPANMRADVATVVIAAIAASAELDVRGTIDMWAREPSPETPAA